MRWPSSRISPAVGWTRPRICAGGRGFAAARFADEAERLAGLDVEADAIDGADDTLGAEEAAADAEVDFQVANGEEGLRGGGSCGGAARIGETACKQFNAKSRRDARRGEADGRGGDSTY